MYQGGWEEEEEEVERGFWSQAVQTPCRVWPSSRWWCPVAWYTNKTQTHSSTGTFTSIPMCGNCVQSTVTCARSGRGRTCTTCGAICGGASCGATCGWYLLSHLSYFWSYFLQRLALVCVMQSASWVSPTTPLGISGSSLTPFLTGATGSHRALQLPWMDFLWQVTLLAICMRIWDNLAWHLQLIDPYCTNSHILLFLFLLTNVC